MDRDTRLTAALNRRAPNSAANQRAFGRLLPRKARAGLPRGETAFGSADDRQFAGIHEAVAAEGRRAQWTTRDPAQHRARADTLQYGDSDDIENNWGRLGQLYTDNTDSDYMDTAVSANMTPRRGPRRGRMTTDDTEANWGRVGTLYTDYEDNGGDVTADHEYRYQSAPTDEGTGGYDSHGFYDLQTPKSDGGLYSSNLPIGNWTDTMYANSMGNAQGTVNEGLHIGGQPDRGGPDASNTMMSALTDLASFASRAGMALRNAAGFGPKPARAPCAKCPQRSSASGDSRRRTGQQELRLHDQLRADRARATSGDATHDLMVRRGQAAAATRQLTGSAGGAASKCASVRHVGRGQMATA